MSKRKFAVTLTLKSGVQLSAECDRFALKRNGLGNPVSMEWENLSTQWMHVDFDEIAAVQCDEIR